MRLMLHTFKKDLRRLWPAAAATWVMLAALANADRWRADWIPSPMEGWMNLLLTMAWVCLAALAVLEEPLVGDRNFWTTRPHRWPALLAAKLVFVVLAIHLPSLLADLFVLSARGFSPAAYLGELLSKQMLFFGTVTLPSIALASLVRNFTHFIIAVFTIAAGIAILNDGFQRFPEFRGQQSEVRYLAVRILLAAGAEYAVGSRGSRETPRIALRGAPNNIDAVTGAGAGGTRQALYFAGVSTSRDRPPDWLALRFSKAAWERVKNARVRVRGSGSGGRA